MQLDANRDTGQQFARVWAWQGPEKSQNDDRLADRWIPSAFR